MLASELLLVPACPAIVPISDDSHSLLSGLGERPVSVFSQGCEEIRNQGGASRIWGLDRKSVV